MSFREFWFTYLCMYLLALPAVWVFSALQIYVSWGYFNPFTDVGFWLVHLPFNILFYSVVYMGFLSAWGIVCYVDGKFKVKLLKMEGGD